MLLSTEAWNNADSDSAAIGDSFDVFCAIDSALAYSSLPLRVVHHKLEFEPRLSRIDQ